MGPEDSRETVGGRARAGRRGAPPKKSRAAKKVGRAAGAPRLRRGRFFRRARFFWPALRAGRRVPGPRPSAGSPRGPNHPSFIPFHPSTGMKWDDFILVCPATMQTSKFDKFRGRFGSLMPDFRPWRLDLGGSRVARSSPERSGGPLGPMFPGARRRPLCLAHSWHPFD